MSSDFPKRLGETAKDPRALELSPDEFAPHVKATDGAEITSYENDTGELPVSIFDPLCAAGSGSV